MEILTFSEAAGVIVMHTAFTATGQDQGSLTQTGWELNTLLVVIIKMMNTYKFIENGKLVQANQSLNTSNLNVYELLQQKTT